MTRDRRLYGAALRYADHGWPIFPLHTPTLSGCSCGGGCGSPGKHPRTRGGVHDATLDPGRIAGWWRRWPDANIGLACGPAGLVVIDVDLPDGPASLRRLETGHGPLPATCTQRTGSGGHQLLYTDAGGLRNRTRLQPGIDVRGDGGYIVVPPSVHVSGGRYRWTDRRPPAPVPGWLADLVQRHRTLDPPAAAKAAVELAAGGDRDGRYAVAALQREVAGVRAETGAGNRNNRLYQAAYALGRLVAGGLLDPHDTRAQLTAAAHAVGLGDREIARTVTSGFERAAARPRTRPTPVLPPPRSRPRPDVTPVRGRR